MNITHQIHEQPTRESDDVRFYRNGVEIPGFGYKPKREGSKICLIRCPSCDRENYVMAVSEGVCAWCGYDPNDR